MSFKSELGVFSPEGRLIQTEFAQCASNQGGTAVIHSRNGIITVAYENRVIDPLLISLPRIHVVDPDRNIYIMFSGFKPDSLLVLDEAVVVCRSHKYSTSVDMPLNTLVRKVADFQQKFTVDHGYRPLGLRSIIMGIESGEGRIFVVDTDGTTGEYKKVAVGFKNNVCNSFLEKNEEDGSALLALKEVVQNDSKKVKVFYISENGCEEADEERISQIMAWFGYKINGIWYLAIEVFYNLL